MTSKTTKTKSTNGAEQRAAVVELISEAQRLAKSAKSAKQWTEVASYLRSAYYRAKQLAAK